jgi:hypothetical protein
LALHEAEPLLNAPLHCVVVSGKVSPESPPLVVIPVSENLTEPVGLGPAPVTVAWYVTTVPWPVTGEFTLTVVVVLRV